MDEQFKKYDSLGVRPFVKMSDSGTFAIEVWRKKTKKESTGDGDWRMIRHGQVQTYFSREEANYAVIKLAEKVYNEHLITDKK